MIIFHLCALVLNVCLSEDIEILKSPYTLHGKIEQNLNDQVNHEYDAFYLYEQLVSLIPLAFSILFSCLSAPYNY